MAPGRANGLSKSQASLLNAVCACNYKHSPLTLLHKPSFFVSRFTPSRHFYCELSTQSFLSHIRVREFFSNFFHTCCRNFRTENPSMDFQIRTRIFILKILSLLCSHLLVRGFFSLFFFTYCRNLRTKNPSVDF